MSHQIIRKLMFTLLVLTVAAFDASAAFGDLDTSFSGDGKYQDSATNTYAADVALQPDGKILVAGYRLDASGRKRFLLRRLTAIGIPDPTFGSNGTAVFSNLINVNDDYAGGEIAILSGGRIAVVGQAGDRTAVWVAGANGYADGGFGSNGFKSTGFPPISPRIVALGGRAHIGVFDPVYQRLAVVKFNPDGSFDQAFGIGGVARTGIYHRPNATHALSFAMFAENDANRITAGGLASPNGSDVVLTFDRQNADGSDDFSFASSTQTVSTYNSSSHISTGLVKTSTGEYVFTRRFWVPPGTFTKIVKLNGNGTIGLEHLFGVDAGGVVGEDAGGNLVVSGWSRYRRFDPVFNQLAEFDPQPYVANAYTQIAALQPDGKLVLAGRKDDKLTVARVLAE